MNNNDAVFIAEQKLEKINKARAKHQAIMQMRMGRDADLLEKAADWSEDKHPRAEDGKFGAKTGGGEAPKESRKVTAESWTKSGWSNPSGKSTKHTVDTKASLNSLLDDIKSGEVTKTPISRTSIYFEGKNGDNLLMWVEDGAAKVAYVKDGERVGDIAGSIDALKDEAGLPKDEPKPAPKAEAKPEAPAEKKPGKTFDPQKKNGRIYRGTNGGVSLETPYDPDFVTKAKKIGGRWDAANKRWAFEPGESSVKAEKLFDKSYNDLNDQAAREKKADSDTQGRKKAQTYIEAYNSDDEVAYNPQKQIGHLAATSGGVAVSGEYNPGFTDEIKGIAGRRWEDVSKTWIVPHDKVDQAQQIFDKYYNNGGNTRIAAIANKAKKEAQAQEKAEYEREARKEPATSKQFEYLRTLAARYISADGSPIEIDKNMSKRDASNLIEALKGGEEQVSYRGWFER